MSEHVTSDVASPPVVLIVTGPPAGGKTTVGTRLAHDLRLPYLSKDMFKETLFEALGWSDRAWSRRLGGASMQLLFRCAAALLEARCSMMLESNFYDRWDTPQLLALQQRHPCRFVQVVCTAPGALLVERFERRAQSGDRHAGHGGNSSLEDIRAELLSGAWGSLRLDSPVITVDTSEFATVDYATLAHSIQELMSGA